MPDRVMVGLSANCASWLEKRGISIWGRQYWHCALTSLLPHRFHSSFLAGQSSNWVLQIWRMKMKLGTLIKARYIKTWRSYANELFVSKLGFDSVDQLAHQALWLPARLPLGASNYKPPIVGLALKLLRTHSLTLTSAGQPHNDTKHSRTATQPHLLHDSGCLSE